MGRVDVVLKVKERGVLVGSRVSLTGSGVSAAPIHIHFDLADISFLLPGVKVLQFSFGYSMWARRLGQDR